MSQFIIFSIIYSFFVYGCYLYIKHYFQLKKYFKNIVFSKIALETIEVYAKHRQIKLPHIAIFVPARNEGLVIENTMRRLLKLDYPKNSYSVHIIVDERERADNVDVYTADVVKRISKELALSNPDFIVNMIEVPEWYNGVFASLEKTHKKSTKGRALNFALQEIMNCDKYKDIDMIGILDADGRLNTDVLKEVALKRLQGFRLLQGPVFQISNFDNISITGISAGLELAMHHMTELPSKMDNDKVQFLAGTNYFIEKTLIIDVGGWNQESLVEDAELAIRIYVEKKVKSSWLNCPELEQSPGTFRVYRKQRERWTRGQLYLISYILSSKLTTPEKIMFFKRIFYSQFRFIVDFFIPIYALILLLNGYFVNLNPILRKLSFIMLLISILIWEIYGHMYRRLIPYMVVKKGRITRSIKLFMFLPIFMVIQAIPRIEALKNYFFNKKLDWYKTERTKELVTE